MEQKKNDLQKNLNFLKVEISDINFKRKFNYFITVQWSVTQEKKRTEVSELFQNPVFRKSNFLFQIPSQNLSLGHLVFNAFIATDKENTTVDIKGRAKFLGKFIINLQEFSASLTDIQKGGVFLPAKFKRNNKIVGKFFISIKYECQQQEQQQQQYQSKSNIIDTTIEKNQFDMNLLPKNFFSQNTKYRIRINVYQGLFLFNKDPAITKEDKPSFQCKCFIKYKDNKADIHEELTKLVSNQENPIFNKQFLLNIKSNNLDECILVIEFDNYNDKQQNEIFKFDLNKLQPFQIINLQAKGCQIKNQYGSRFYFSFVLEELKEDLALLVIKHLEIDPRYDEYYRYLIGLDFDQNNNIEFQQIQNTNNEIKLSEYQSKSSKVYMSTLLKNPSIEIDSQNGGIAYFVLPFIMLKNKFTISLYFEMFSDKNTLQDKYSQQNPKINYLLLQKYAQKELFIYNREFQIGQNLDLFEEKLERIQGENIINPKLSENIQNSDMKIQIGCKKLIKTDMQIQKQKQKDISDKILKEQNLTDVELKLLSDNLKVALEVSNDREKWKILSKEVSQKQDLITRFVQEYDEKQTNLKKTINNIVELKQQIKYLQNEKDQLEKQLQLEEVAQLKFEIKQELENMNEEELRIKLIRVAQQYRDEKNRNIQFEQTLEKAHQDLLNAKQLQKEFDELSVQNLEKNKELMKMNKEISKIQMYQDTIEKQDLVIQRLEQNLEECVTRTEKNQKLLEQIKETEKINKKLRKQIQEETKIFQSSSDIDQLKTEIQNLEKIKLNLENEIERNYPIKQSDKEEEIEQLQLEIELQKYEQRVKALEKEIFQQNQQHAQEMNEMDNLLNDVIQQLINKILKQFFPTDQFMQFNFLFYKSKNILFKNFYLIKVFQILFNLLQGLLNTLYLFKVLYPLETLPFIPYHHQNLKRLSHFLKYHQVFWSKNEIIYYLYFLFFNIKNPHLQIYLIIGLLLYNLQNHQQVNHLQIVLHKHYHLLLNILFHVFYCFQKILQMNIYNHYFFNSHIQLQHLPLLFQYKNHQAKYLNLRFIFFVINQIHFIFTIMTFLHYFICINGHFDFDVRLYFKFLVSFYFYLQNIQFFYQYLNFGHFIYYITANI